MSFANVRVAIQVYDDPSTISNPQLRHADWNRLQMSLPCSKATSQAYTLLPAESVTVIDGSRALTADATTQIALTTSTLSDDRYRMTWTATGTNPGFRTNRAFAAATYTLAVVLNTNGSITISSGAGPNYAAVVVGDTVLIPGVTTGDVVGPFDTLNEGYWTVLTKTSGSMTLVRPTGDAFTAAAQPAVAVTSNSQIQVMSSAGIQVGDTIEISGGFSTSAWHSCTVLSVAAVSIDIQSSTALGAETVLLGSTTAMLAYRDAKKLVYVESDQEVAVQVNGDTGQTQRVEPWEAAVDGMQGNYLKTGTTWKLVLLNRSSASASVVVVTAAG